MEKSIYSSEYRQVVILLRELREAKGVTQVELAEQLSVTQSYLSKVERGERVLDVVQLRTICIALGTTLPTFVRRLESRISNSS